MSRQGNRIKSGNAVTRFYEDGRIEVGFTEEQWAKVKEIQARPLAERTPDKTKSSLRVRNLFYDVSYLSGGGDMIKGDW